MKYICKCKQSYQPQVPYLATSVTVHIINDFLLTIKNYVTVTAKINKIKLPIAPVGYSSVHQKG